jgi:uncharacterized protein (DUF697 family)
VAQPLNNQPGPPPDSEAAAALIKSCLGTISTCGVVAAVAAFVPLPVADSVVITIVQFYMVHSLCERYNRQMGGSAVFVILAAMLGPLVFNLLLEALPVAGWIISAGVAFFFTRWVGNGTLELLAQNRPFGLGNFFSALFGGKKKAASPPGSPQPPQPGVGPQSQPYQSQPSAGASFQSAPSQSVSSQSAAAQSSDLYEALQKLNQLKNSGLLTQAEFDQQKAKLLSK